MTVDILLKRSDESGKVPTVDDIKYGELLLNYADGVIYFKDNSNNVRYFKAYNAAEDNGLSDMYVGYYGETSTTSDTSSS